MTESKDWRVLKRIASEVAGELNEALDVMMFGKPGAKKPVAEILWDNKIGILRVLQAVALTHPEAQGNKDLGEPPLTRLEVRDEIAAIMVQWQMDGPSYPLEGARKFLVECREGKHSGDCTKSPWTCLRCQCDDAYLQADAVLLALQAQRVAQAAPTSPQPIKGDNTEALTDAATVQALEGL